MLTAKIDDIRIIGSPQCVSYKLTYSHKPIQQYLHMIHVTRDRQCDVTHQSSGSQSLNPLANGLLAIFSCVICNSVIDKQLYSS